MDILFEKQRKKVSRVSLEFTRHAIDEIPWDQRLVGIKGSRGVGKTTLMLQYIKRYFPESEDVLYVSLDDIWFSSNSLVVLADQFVKYGGKRLFLDEVHKYPDWASELKNIYDDHSGLQVVFTGSSMLELLNARADLSRRAVIYRMQGISFREYLEMETGLKFPVVLLDTVLQDHISVTDSILEQLRPLKYYEQYIKSGYYPFYLESGEFYFMQLEEIINYIIEVELPLLRGVDVLYARKLKALLMIIAESAPFIPNIVRLAERTGINRNTLLTYIHYLEEAELIHTVYKQAKGITRLQKPDKLLLNNTNIAHAITPGKPDAGSLRESFFVNQAGFNHAVTYAERGDFVLNDQLLFEIGGRSKGKKQLNAWPDGKRFLVADDIEYGYRNRIPLWLFGFLY
jgi:hypothetical protein